MAATTRIEAADRDVELIGRFIDAYNADDFEALLEVLHPDVTIVPTPKLLSPGIVYHGHDGFRSITADMNAMFASVQIRPHVVRRVNEQILTVWTAVERRRGASAPTSRKAVHLISCEDGLVRRIEGFPSEMEAMAAANRQHPIAAAGRYLEAMKRRDADGMVAECRPDVQVFPSAALVSAGTEYTGHDGIRSMVAGYGRWRCYAVESQEIAETNGRIMASMVVARGESPDTATRFEIVVLLTFEDDKIRLVEGFSQPHGEPDANPSGDEYRTLFDAIPDPTFLVDDDCRLIDANAAAEQRGIRSLQRGRSLADLLSLPMLRGEQWQEILDEGQLCQDFGPDSAIGDGERGELRVKASFLPHRHLVILRSGAPEGESAPAPVEPLLTPREREVFRLLALGLSGRDIAHQLFLSPETVRTHAQNGVVRLGARTRGQAIAIALTRGEISL